MLAASWANRRQPSRAGHRVRWFAAPALLLSLGLGSALLWRDIGANRVDARVRDQFEATLMPAVGRVYLLRSLEYLRMFDPWRSLADYKYRLLSVDAIQRTLLGSDVLSSNGVLLDFTMPHLDSKQAFREIRRIRPDVRVILCSGYNRQDATQRFVGKGLGWGHPEAVRHRRPVGGGPGSRP